MNNGIIILISQFLADYLNLFILALGVVELVIMLISVKKLYGLRCEIDRLNNPADRVLVGLFKRKKRVHQDYAIENVLDWTEFDTFCNRYQNDIRYYTAFVMIIQHFTLLGILGTVCGLYISLINMNGLSESVKLFDGVKFALSSTILGIIMAVLYKTADTIICSGFVCYIEDGIVRFKNNYHEDKETED